MTDTAFPALVEADGKLKKAQDDLGKIFKEAGPEVDLTKVTTITGDTKAKAEAIRALNEECAELCKEVESLKAVARAAEAAKGFRDGRGEESGGQGREEQSTKGGKSVGELFAKSKAFGKAGASQEATLDLELKTLFSTSGWEPEVTRTGRVVEFATRPIAILDLIPMTTTNQAAVQYMEETTFTNNAAETAEAGTYPESALGLTERTSPVRKITTYLPVTDELFEDEPRSREYVNNRLPFMLRQRLAAQALVGNGTAPNLRGIANVSGIQTQAKGADPSPDAVYKAMTKVRVVGQAMPDAVVYNPLDWQDVRLLRTADGIYIWGSPSESGPERIWGLSVVQEQAQTEDTAIVGDWGNFSELAMRRGIDIQVSNSHADYFINGKQAIRADMRAALVFYRPAAFCTVTGV